MNTTALALVDVALRGALLALLVLMAVVLWRERPQLPVVRAAVLLCLGLCMQVLSSTPPFEEQVPWIWQLPLVAVSVGNAVLFWVFVQALFDDDFVLRAVHTVAWISVAALAVVNCAMGSNSGPVLAPIMMGLQRAVPLVFSVLAALAAARHWRADLIEERRRLRAFIVVTGVAYTLASLAARLVAPHGRLLGLTATLDVVGLLVIVGVVAAWMLRLTDSSLFAYTGSAALPVHQATHAAHAAHAVDSAGATPPGGAAATPELRQAPALDTGLDARLAPPDPAEDRLAQALQHAMAVERAYRTEDLSLAALAARLAVPEYRLRRLINQRLGYRNFNAFINGYRLDEVRAALLDPARRELPVLTLALDAGFQSIGPFNRAFKAATGLTPTEFRKENRADS